MHAIRTFYADLVAAKGGTRDPRIRAAFAAVDRAAFLGKGPWKIFTPTGYIDTPSDDEAFLWHDVAVAIAPERSINNGEPSLHARCLAACEPQWGESVVHVGAGSGYYTALLAELVGERGHVDAYEIEVDLAATATAQLGRWSNVGVHGRSAAEGVLPSSDVIYVCAGASRPLDLWLDALRTGGRLIFPLTSDRGIGFVLLVTRLGDERFAARIVSPAAFIACSGARDEQESQALLAALSRGGHGGVRSLRRGAEKDETTWLEGRGWSLSTREP